MFKNDAIKMRHMLDATGQAVQFVQNKNRNDLDTEPMLMFALMK